MFHQTVDELQSWMEHAHTDQRLVRTVIEYLKGRGKQLMKRICHNIPALDKVAKEIDQIGWDNMVEGRISRELVSLQRHYLQSNAPRYNIRTWTKTFIEKLLHITHRQWLYRNARLHIRLVEGMTSTEHETIMDRVSTLLETNQLDLLPMHEKLLDQDFERLGAGPSADRLHWIAQMESALDAASIIKGKRTLTLERRPQDDHHCRSVKRTRR
jgi:hypothetical protein